MEDTSAERNSALFDALVRVQIHLWNAIDDRIRVEYGLRLGTFQIMRVIAQRDGCRVNDVADEMLITIGGASKLIDRLEAAAHCERTANPDDRRSSIIRLTASGTALLDRATETFDRALEESLAPLTATDKKTMSLTLNSLRGQS